ncbi:hypothetical protein Asppvi_009877 [Aspergillus pseudoviridinutans]|uniref:Uncharacterized protein n=1 Tax=Aspergillus pseudoviridinutans TaxID=1517512 RepID=A0A9P3BGT5_9EURO|nr:uncharacterized protein Asppvi_009877 [Aspergillus pseudoviridinutans]GIJ90912.1 hypothetical protein Asppvi_009877 [Aspergillus pseudoviridinutans]
MVSITGHIMGVHGALTVTTKTDDCHPLPFFSDELNRLKQAKNASEEQGGKNECNIGCDLEQLNQAETTLSAAKRQEPSKNDLDPGTLPQGLEKPEKLAKQINCPERTALHDAAVTENMTGSL